MLCIECKKDLNIIIIMNLSTILNWSTIVTGDKVAAHEDHLEFSRELVLSVPHRVVLLVKVLPEPRKCDGLSVVVRVLLLELVHVECSTTTTTIL